MKVLPQRGKLLHALTKVIDSSKIFSPQILEPFGAEFGALFLGCSWLGLSWRQI